MSMGIQTPYSSTGLVIFGIARKCFDHLELLLLIGWLDSHPSKERPKVRPRFTGVRASIWGLGEQQTPTAAAI